MDNNCCKLMMVFLCWMDNFKKAFEYISNMKSTDKPKLFLRSLPRYCVQIDLVTVLLEEFKKLKNNNLVNTQEKRITLFK